MVAIDLVVADDRLHALQGDLIEEAETLTYEQLQYLCRHATEVLDPEGADARLAEQLEAEEARALAQTTLAFRPGGPGLVAFSGKLPTAQADFWRAGLEAFSAPRHETNAGRTWLDRSAPEGVEGLGDELTDPQRLGRAFCQLLEHLPTDELPQHGVANATIVLTMQERDLAAGIGEAILDTGCALSPGQTRRLACNAKLIPAVLDGPSKILDLGVARWLFDRTQRIALHVRDQGCIFPGCDRVAAWCEAHHLRCWSAGGPTDLSNGCLLCPFHHHLIHQGDWIVVMAGDGVPEVIPPSRIDARRAPRRHERFDRGRGRPPDQPPPG